MTVLSIDYETKSKVDLIKSGLHTYARDPSTRVLMAAYAIDDGEVQLWQPHLSPKAPAELRDAMRDPSVVKRAWNAPFESEMTEHTLGLKVQNWRDTMVSALYASLPAQLAMAGPALGLPEDVCKMPDGKRLIRKFSMPKADGTFRDWKSDEDDWALFCDYCKRDVTVEREIARRLSSIPVPDAEWALWDLDQRINRRGLPVDLDFVRKAIAMGAEEKARLIHMLKRETGLTNPMTQAGFLDWARDHGYPYSNLQKGTVARAIREGEMSDYLVRVMGIRGDAAKTSIKKYDSILAKTQNDRLYNTVQFYGASRTGRWAGRDPQVQNFPRPMGEIEGVEEHYTDMVKAEAYDDILMEFGGAMPLLSGLTRSSFRAPEGRIFHIADLNAIENRVLGWVANCQAILDVFHNDLDPYKAFGAKMFHKPYDEITKSERTVSKPAVLGCGYRLGGGDEVADKDGDLILTGLWGYAAAMGITMTREQAHESVKVFRAAYPEVVQCWYDLQNAAMDAVRNFATVRVGPLVFNGSANLMRIRLPSGRDLHYIRPRIEKVKATFSKQVPDGTNDDGTPRFKTVSETKLVDALTYEGTHTKTKKWCRLSTHGGKLMENCLSGQSEILTHRGWVRLVDITTADCVWDGLSFVRHGGVIAKGVQPVRDFGGVRLTDDHRIYTLGGWEHAANTNYDEATSAFSGHFGTATRDALREALFRHRDDDAAVPEVGRSSCGANVRPAQHEEQVYDILNAGPNHRFTVRGADGRMFLAHNCVQAIARDVLAAGLVKADAVGYDIVLHAHDEIVGETDNDNHLTPDILAGLMSEPLDWAPGLPLKAVGMASMIYRK